MDEMMEDTKESPKWGSTTKLIVGLTSVAIAGLFFTRFNNLIAPVLFAFVLAFLFYPAANFLRVKVKFSWRLSVSIIFALIFLIFMGLLTWGGFALFDQISSLIGFLQREIVNVPGYLTDLSNQKIAFGPFELDFSQIDLVAIGNQVLSWVQPILARLGTVVGSVASGAAATLGWFFFTILISYFILAESRGARTELIKINIPGYGDDIKRIGEELKRIWNAFLRGQLTIIIITILVYTILLGGLQVDFYFGLAVVAGLARFVPYVGPVVAWTLYGMVTLFQGTTIFGMESFYYAVLVILVAWITDVILDNLVVPRLMGDALEVHPAAVMVFALISANLFGLLGVVLAAPVLATGKLIGQYIFYKMFDIDPWKNFEVHPPQLRASPVWLEKILRRCLPNRKRIEAWILKNEEKRKKQVQISVEENDLKEKDNNGKQ